MAYIKYNTGVVLEWDETISIGTLIRTYYSGYWVLTRIEFLSERERISGLEGNIDHSFPIEWSDKSLYETCPNFHMTQVLRKDGSASKANTKSCSAFYCSRVSDESAGAQMVTEVLAAHRKYDAIKQFVDPYYKS